MTGERSSDAQIPARRAHVGGTSTVGCDTPTTRVAREDQESSTLAAGATLASGAGNRAVPEAPDTWRTCFERDRDRILHGAAFRRLAGKTQVFVFPDDHQRTRMTHALEVAQVATSVSQVLGLNVPLTEAIEYLAQLSSAKATYDKHAVILSEATVAGTEVKEVAK